MFAQPRYKHEWVLGEFGITIENSPTLVCFYQAMYTQLKSFNCFYNITFQRKKKQKSLLMALIKREILAGREVLFTTFRAGNQFLFCKKDTFHNTDFSRLKCQLKRKKLTQCVCKDFSSFRR